MRWQDKPIHFPKPGDRRSVQSFLFVPKCLNNEWRWLENARVVQVYTHVADARGGQGYTWQDEAWAEHLQAGAPNA